MGQDGPDYPSRRHARSVMLTLRRRSIRSKQPASAPRPPEARPRRAVASAGGKTRSGWARNASPRSPSAARAEAGARADVVMGGLPRALSSSLAHRLQRRVSLGPCDGRPAPGVHRDCALLKHVLLDQHLFGDMPLTGDLADHR